MKWICRCYLNYSFFFIRPVSQIIHSLVPQHHPLPHIWCSSFLFDSSFLVSAYLGPLPINVWLSGSRNKLTQPIHLTAYFMRLDRVPRCGWKVILPLFLLLLLRTNEKFTNFCWLLTVVSHHQLNDCKAQDVRHLQEQKVPGSCLVASCNAVNPNWAPSLSTTPRANFFVSHSLLHSPKFAFLQSSRTRGQPLTLERFIIC